VGGATGRRRSITVNSICHALPTVFRWRTRKQSSSVGFSRGGDCASYSVWLTMKIASLWKGILDPRPSSDGQRTWNYPRAIGPVGAETSCRLQGRPVLVCGQHAPMSADQFLNAHLDLARFTLSGHTDTEKYLFGFEGNTCTHTPISGSPRKPYATGPRVVAKTSLQQK